jgi:16S rRNA G966 N2-methylase RsmD
VESVRRFLDACGEAGLGRAAFMPMQAGKALNILAASRESFDLVLMDPPYDSTAGSSILQSSQLVAILSPQASSRVVLEHPGNAEIQAGAALEILRSYRYGGTCLTIFKPAGS